MNCVILCYLFGVDKYPKLKPRCQLTTISFILPIGAVPRPVAPVYFTDAVRIVATGIANFEEMYRVYSGITSKPALCVTRYQDSVLALGNK
jgi:hypothetical protein